MWGRFFDSLGGGGGDETESALSGSRLPRDIMTPPPYSDSPMRTTLQSPGSEVHPDDSASVMNDDASALEAYPKRHGTTAVSSVGFPAAALVDDGTYVFKFRTPSGRTHRFQARHDNIENLRDIVIGKLTTDPFFAEFKPAGADDPIPDPMDFSIAYTDADGDTVLMTSDSDVNDAVSIARKAGTDRVVLFIQGGKAWDQAGAKESEVKAAEAVATAQREVKEVEKAEETLPEGVSFAPPTPVHVQPVPTDDVFGIPRDMILPASIGALAAVVVGVFMISRLTSSSSRY